MFSEPDMAYSHDAVIQCHNLGKCYRIYDNPKARLKQAFWRGRRQYFREFWALRDVSFEVKRGESLGIVGRNGSGKSTLLQLICGTLTPTEGYIQTDGRIAALLELGSGFNPEFTGIENVYLNASMLGLSKDFIDQRIDKILSFADIGPFTRMPVKTYSSGMAVRLAFAVQAQIEPDILVIDEALAVGDAKFQAKCYRHIKSLRENGTSILLVTHDGQATIKHCSRSILVDSGKLLLEGEPKTVFYKYLDLIHDKTDPSILASIPEEETSHTEAKLSSVPEPDRSDDVFDKRPGYNNSETRWGDGSARITDFILTSRGVRYPSYISCGDSVHLRIVASLSQYVANPIFGISIRSKSGMVISETNTLLLGLEYDANNPEGACIATVDYTFNCSFAAGDYFISIGVNSMSEKDIMAHDRRWDSIHFAVQSDQTFGGLVDCSISIKASFEAG